MEKPVLIIIDMLNDFLDGWEAAPREQLIQSTNELIAIMRKRNCPIIWVRQEFESDLSDAFLEMREKRISITIKGTRGSQIASELLSEPSDTVIIKKRYSAFFETDLDQVLKKLSPASVIFAGINTHACIRTAVIDAYQRDWPVIVASDCVGSRDQQHHEITLKYLKDHVAKVMTNKAIEKTIDFYHL